MKGRVMQDFQSGPIVSHPLRLSDLGQRKATHVRLAPDAAQMKALAEALAISDLRKLTFDAELRPARGADWILEARLGATVVQPCRVSLEPVTTRIDEVVRRQYLSNWQDAVEDEAEMPDDETAEPLPAMIDLGAVMEEALALALPAFPRADSVEIIDLTAAPKGAVALNDDAVKPFAGLAGLKAQLEKDKD
jgi:uncharacterized metal-binding protein YceD (DUF177 family)